LRDGLCVCRAAGNSFNSQDEFLYRLSSALSNVKDFELSRGVDYGHGLRANPYDRVECAAVTGYWQQIYRGKVKVQSKVKVHR